MIHDQIIDFRHVYDLFQLVQIFVKEFFLGGLKQYGLSASFPYIGIIGRAEFRVHDDVKHTKIVVHNTSPVESVSQFQCFHNRPSLSFIVSLLYRLSSKARCQISFQCLQSFFDPVVEHIRRYMIRQFYDRF